MTRDLRPAVFLDRDGTIIEDADYLTSADQLRLLPGAARAMRRLKEAGFLLIVVTNQSAVARGWLDEAAIPGIHRELDRMLSADGVPADAYYHCPHLPGGSVPEYGVECDCRKPAPGMLLRAAADRQVDLERSYMVGDSMRDVRAGQAVGCYSILLGPKADEGADATAPDLAGAADIILRLCGHG